METGIIPRYYWEEKHPSLCVWLINSIEHSQAKSITYVNLRNDETQTQNPLWLGFCLGINRFQV